MGQVVARGLGRVLVIEDDPDLLLTICQALVANGCNPTRATTAEEALAALERGPRPDLMLVDLYLPRVSGEELIVQLRRDARWREIPIVAMTAYPPDLRSRALSDAFLPKPFTLEALEDLVTVLCRSPRSRPDAAMRLPT